MKNKHRMYACTISVLLLLMLMGCQKADKKDAALTHIYYVDNGGTLLKKEAYEFREEGNETQVEQMLDALQKEPDSAKYKSVFPKGVTIVRFELNEENLDIYFNRDYGEMKKADEVLLRAAVVQSVVQIEGIDYVSFYVEGVPLTDSEGESVGYMHGDNFVKNTGSSLHSYQLAKIPLYFSNRKGDKLVKEEMSIRYNSNMSVEKLIVEQLIKGPSTQEYQATILPETKVLGVSVKDNICYVNLDENFVSPNYTNANYSMDSQVCIYSIVNSIVDAGTASQVQISVNGETNVQFRGSVDLSKPFSRNLDIVEEITK